MTYELKKGDRVMYTPPKGRRFHNAKRTAVVAGPAEPHLGVMSLPVFWDDMTGGVGAAHLDHFTLIEAAQVEIKQEVIETARETIEI